MAVAYGCCPMGPEEATEFTVTLVLFGTNRIQTIKKLRELFDMSLYIAKSVVELVPVIVATHLPRYDANRISEELEKVEGVKVRVTVTSALDMVNASQIRMR